MLALSLVEAPTEMDNLDQRHPLDDPLRIRVPLEYDRVYFPYGVPMRLRTNSASVAAAAHDSWSTWTKRMDVPRVEVRCLVAPDSDFEDKCPAPPVMRAQGHLLTITASADNFACCDLATAFAFAWITKAVAEDQDYLRFFFLEAMAYSILSTKFMVFLHAACVASNGEAILLSGESGAGKTSLAYACALRGWTFLSDDASVLSGDERNLVVLGDSRRFRFRDSATSLFPELKNCAGPQRAWFGKPTLEIPTHSLDIQTANEARPRHVVFLKRHDDSTRPAQLLLFRDKKEALNRLQSDAWPEELGTFTRNQRVIQNLLNAPVYELHYSRLEDAVRLLGTILHRDCA